MQAWSFAPNTRAPSFRPEPESAKKKLATSVGSRSAALAARRISLLAECASRARRGDRTG